MKKLLFLALLPFVLTACGNSADNNFVANPNKVVLEEFSDIQCPACKSAHPLIMKLKEHFPEKLEVRFVHFPLQSIHPDAFHAAEAAECAKDQGDEAFWSFIAKAYENQKNLQDETFKNIAAEIGLDSHTFAQCLTSGSKAAIVRRDMKEGNSRRVNSTPTIFLEGEKVENSDRRFEVMVQKIEKLMKAKESPKKSL